MEKRSLSRIKAIDSFDGTLLRCVAMNERISQASSDKRTKSQNVADQNKSLRPLEELEELRKVIEVHENELTRLRNINDILVAERSRYFPMMKELLSSRDTLKKQKDLRNRRKNEKASDYIHSLFNGVPDNDEAQDTSDDEDDPDEASSNSLLHLSIVAARLYF